MKTPSGTIALFWGLLAAIPGGWKSCNGTLGTPDLRDRFIRGAGIGLAPHLSGGSAVHNHSFTTDGHYHTLPSGTVLGTGLTFREETDSQTPSGTTDNATMLPLYMALIYIQKI